MSETNGDKYIRYGLFFWVIGGIVGFVMLIGSFLYGGVHEVTDDVTIIKGDVIEIKTHIEYIRAKFETQEIGKVIDLQKPELPEPYVVAPVPTVYEPDVQPLALPEGFVMINGTVYPSQEWYEENVL